MSESKPLEYLDLQEVWGLLRSRHTVDGCESLHQLIDGTVIYRISTMVMRDFEKPSTVALVFLSGLARAAERGKTQRSQSQRGRCHAESYLQWLSHRELVGMGQSNQHNFFVHLNSSIRSLF